MPSRFDKDTIREYFEWAARTGKKRVGSIEALTDHAHKTGNNDLEIKAWLFPEDAGNVIVCPTCEGRGRIVKPETSEPVKPPCHICHDTGYAISFDPDKDADVRTPCPFHNGDEYAAWSQEQKLRESERVEESRGGKLTHLATIPLPPFAKRALAKVTSQKPDEDWEM
jgi:hypothetical protein